MFCTVKTYLKINPGICKSLPKLPGVLLLAAFPCRQVQQVRLISSVCCSMQLHRSCQTASESKTESIFLPYICTNHNFEYRNEYTAISAHTQNTHPKPMWEAQCTYSNTRLKNNQVTNLTALTHDTTDVLCSVCPGAFKANR